MSDDNPQGGNEELQKLLDKHQGNATALSMQLWGELLEYRRKNRDLRGKVPAEGSVVLTKEQAAEYGQARAVLQTLADLKVKPEELKAKIEGAAAENAKLRRESERNALAELGYSRASLADFDDLEGREIESYVVRDEQKDGKPVKVAYVTVGGKERPFDEYAKEKRPALASVLKSEGQQGGIPYVPQSAGGRAPAGNKYDDIRKDVKKREEARSGSASDLHPIFRPPQQPQAAS